MRRARSLRRRFLRAGPQESRARDTPSPPPRPPPRRSPHRSGPAAPAIVRHQRDDQPCLIYLHVSSLVLSYQRKRPVCAHCRVDASSIHRAGPVPPAEPQKKAVKHGEKTAKGSDRPLPYGMLPKRVSPSTPTQHSVGAKGMSWRTSLINHDSR